MTAGKYLFAGSKKLCFAVAATAEAEAEAEALADDGVADERLEAEELDVDEDDAEVAVSDADEVGGDLSTVEEGTADRVEARVVVVVTTALEASAAFGLLATRGARALVVVTSTARLVVVACARAVVSAAGLVMTSVS